MSVGRVFGAYVYNSLRYRFVGDVREDNLVRRKETRLVRALQQDETRVGSRLDLRAPVTYRTRL